MSTNNMNNEKMAFLQIFHDLDFNGEITSPRGLKVKEIENYNYILHPYERFCSFKDRKLNLPYIKQEFKWYLNADLHDISITKHAKMWEQLVTSLGTILSNYGHYVFGSGAFYRVAHELKNDKESRRGSIMILNNTHIESNGPETPCTYSLNFRIRNNKLNMTVNMRSQDIIFGMGNDAPCFSFIHEMMYVLLKDYYEKLEYGLYYHHADSFHIYEKHFKMLDSIVENYVDFEKIECPKILNADEVKFLIRHDFTNIPEEFEFSKWLNI